MHVAVVAVSDKRSETLKKRAQAVAREFSMMGHISDLFESVDSRLSGFDFIAVCSEPVGMGSGIGVKLSEQLAQGGHLVGKRSMALLVKAGLFSNKALALLMKSLEKEGMVVTMGEIVANDGEAAAAARDAPLSRS